MKYEKNKDFLILRDFKQENLMNTYYPKMKMYLRKKIFIYYWEEKEKKKIKY